MYERPAADMKRIKQAKIFLRQTGAFNDWYLFREVQEQKWMLMPDWQHTDRLRATRRWLHSRLFLSIEIPEDMDACLVEYWETHRLHLKKAV